MRKLTVMGLCVALTCFGLALETAHAEGWLVLTNTGFVSGDSTLTLTMPFVGQPSLTVTSSTPGDLKWVAIGIPFTAPNAIAPTIDGVAVCYKTSNPNTFISQTRLAEYLGPSFATVRHDDGTDRTSTTDECYFSPVADYVPAGAVTLSLRLNFADASHVISIGAVAIHVK